VQGVDGVVLDDGQERWDGGVGCWGGEAEGVGGVEGVVDVGVGVEGVGFEAEFAAGGEDSGGDFAAGVGGVSLGWMRWVEGGFITG
jgi:hypothetical protein